MNTTPEWIKDRLAQEKRDTIASMVGWIGHRIFSANAADINLARWDVVGDRNGTVIVKHDGEYYCTIRVTVEPPEPCEHPGAFAHPDRESEHCWHCGRDVPRAEL